MFPTFRARARVQPDLSGESRAKQSFKKECDINTIMAKYRQTGLVDHVNRYQGEYGDFTQTPSSYHDAMNQVLAAGEMFLTVPANIRARFQNDPGAFLSFVENPDNADEMREMGLLPRKRPSPETSPEADAPHNPPGEAERETPVEAS